MPRRLAQTLWPRSGGDAKNRRLWHGHLQAASRIDQVAVLPSAADPSESDKCGQGAISVDGAVYLAHHGYLSRLGATGSVEWSIRLSEEIPSTANLWARATWHSAPTVLEDGSVWITHAAGGAVISARGEVLDYVDVGTLDDSGLSPAVLTNGDRILTSPAGQVWLWGHGKPRQIGVFGYDILPPAIYPDDTLGIAGYAGYGFCRVSREGAVLWQSQLAEEDLLPTINRDNEAAVGSLNNNLSAVYAADGRQLFQYDTAAIFAEHICGDWIALSEESVARLDRKGRVLWKQPIYCRRTWGQLGPITDASGAVYVIEDGALLTLDADGQEADRLELPAGVRSFFPFSADTIAAVSPVFLYLISR